jgi:hypothetical protein
MRRRWSLAAPLVSLSLLAAMALPAGATAAVAEFLPSPAKGTTFKGTFGKDELQVKGGNTTKCEKGRISGEITSQTAIKVTIDREGCKALGFTGNTPGDATGVELFEAGGELCTLSKAAKTVGLLVKLPTTVIEVPTAKLKIEIKGSLIGEVTSINKSQVASEVVYTQKEGKQSIEKCEGGAAQLLLVKETEGEFKQAGMAARDALEYAKAIEVMSA